MTGRRVPDGRRAVRGRGIGCNRSGDRAAGEPGSDCKIPGTTGNRHQRYPVSATATGLHAGGRARCPGIRLNHGRAPHSVVERRRDPWKDRHGSDGATHRRMDGAHFEVRVSAAIGVVTQAAGEPAADRKIPGTTGDRHQRYSISESATGQHAGGRARCAGIPLNHGRAPDPVVEQRAPASVVETPGPWAGR